MNADLLYVEHNPQAIPLVVLSSVQWEEMKESCSVMESNYFNSRQFSGNLGDWCCLYDAQGQVNKAYVGSGKGAMQQALAYASLLLPEGCYQLEASPHPSSAVFWALAQYRFTRYKKSQIPLKQLVCSAKKEVVLLANALFLVRDLINTPANDMGPVQLAETLQHVAKQYEAHFEQWVGDALLEHHYPAIHAVGRASIHPPRLLSLSWGNKAHPKLTLVGKGVCFDSGGLDIKPSSAMRLMKKDMAGAAHAIGLAQWIMASGLPVRLQVLIPAVENAIGPDAFRPGDILTMRNGLTVEIDNTDAEGRLVLADALVKAGEDQPDLLIDFSTLTGAARVALGTEVAALFANDDALAEAVVQAGMQEDDPIWRLPLFAGYEDMLNSTVADLVNSSASGYAGAITAGLFLQRFVNTNSSWLHFDLMGWSLVSKPGKPEGGEAMGLRALAQFLAKRYG